MLRKGNKCWIKIVPLVSKSNSSSLHFILNNEEHHWDIYDKNGNNVHIVYLQGSNIEPSFYLKSKNRIFIIQFRKDEIKIMKISKNHDMKGYINNNCNICSPKANCWAIAIYHTRESEKFPYDLI
jgi:hypothetical protein